MLKLQILGAFIIAIILSGCGAATPPQPFQVKKEQTRSNITYEERNTILLKEFQELYKEKKFLGPQSYKKFHFDASICDDDTASIGYKGTNAYFEHLFYINKQTNALERIDISRQLHGEGRGKEAYCTLCDDNGFSEYINEFQEKLEKIYLQKIHEFDLYKVKHNQAFERAKQKEKEVTVKLIEPSNVLSTKQLSIFKPKVYLELTQNLVNAFYNKVNPDDNILMKNTVMTLSRAEKRYTVKFDNFISKKYIDFPNYSEVYIKDIDYIFIPKHFELKNKDLAVSINYSDSLIFPKIEIKNNTDQYLVVDKILYHYAGMTKDDVLQRSLKISPKSTKKIEHYLGDSMEKVTSRKSKVNYGFTINYTLNGTPGTLSSSKNYTIDDFDK